VAVCKTDLIASGQATPQRVIFNAGETFLVTLHDFAIDTWLRMPAVPQRTIRVAVAGGEAILEGQKTKGWFAPTDRLSGPAMLWLKRIPGSQAYGLSTDVGILTFDDDRPRFAFPTWMPALWTGSPANIVTNIVNAAATCR
jgi:hypothetical protein